MVLFCSETLTVCIVSGLFGVHRPYGNNCNLQVSSFSFQRYSVFIFSFAFGTWRSIGYRSIYFTCSIFRDFVPLCVTMVDGNNFNWWHSNRLVGLSKSQFSCWICIQVYDVRFLNFQILSWLSTCGALLFCADVIYLCSLSIETNNDLG